MKPGCPSVDLPGHTQALRTRVEEWCGGQVDHVEICNHDGIYVFGQDQSFDTKIIAFQDRAYDIRGFVSERYEAEKAFHCMCGICPFHGQEG